MSNGSDFYALQIDRLRKRPQFLRVAQGAKASGRYVSLQVCRSDDSPSQQALARFGLTASKKVGNAVLRNRARRRLRSAMLQLLSVHGRPGFDYVAVARTASVTADWPALLDDLTALFVKLSSRLATAHTTAETP
ncbi:ribonuclease P protein component [Candidatus Phycosocius spiralis]|uniref:Ribonuclease P protein component n=1 Tax=Candidatus Phycosocius spiralis TaxID=2815099 RepID=A0ABQ4PW76_9PROT|nr:ribonuclease P protein component [Candidatus Phycosocius spiralis]GIU67221.1 ribonuclease P protein component [Candidatus Phycosocius spiralis]